MTHTRSLLFLGYGYVAKATAARLSGQNIKLSGTTRSAAKASEMALSGISPLINATREELRGAVETATHILVSVPPDEDGDPALPLLRGLKTPALEWLGYLSTTGVYGDAGGGWVDEDTRPEPAEKRSKRRLQAEQGWQAFSKATRIVRLAGIYGPGRSALERVRSGTARRIVKQGQVFSRVHVDDIATALLASMERQDVPGPFNLADDLPSSQAEVIGYAADLLAVAPPPEEDFETAEMSPMMRSFFSSSRRVSSRKTRDALGFELAYPTYREGLEAIYAASV
ncbi:SDR family oxidoreductase [Hyphobacterium sp.]|uniref:SDR family oxidoreductase n=1 Tax=Hyphobacterium sp. TaxID=2004662 RepID=UPI003BADAD74